MDVRIISATHVNLPQAVSRGQFRQDLYFRLAVLDINLPPLRERADDIGILAEQFLVSFRGNRVGGPLRGFSRDALNALHAHDWPGNVRELKSRVQRAVVMCEKRAIMPRDLGLSSHVPRSRLSDLRQAREAAEEELVRRALLLTRDRVAEAARLIGTSHVTLYRLIKKYRIGLDRARGTDRDV
jgi:DNA-binding NtrC family response regulator